jgi:hypothetical protein
LGHGQLGAVDKLDHRKNISPTAKENLFSFTEAAYRTWIISIGIFCRAMAILEHVDALIPELIQIFGLLISMRAVYKFVVSLIRGRPLVAQDVTAPASGPLQYGPHLRPRDAEQINPQYAAHTRASADDPERI